MRGSLGKHRILPSRPPLCSPCILFQAKPEDLHKLETSPGTVWRSLFYPQELAQLHQHLVVMIPQCSRSSLFFRCQGPQDNLQPFRQLRTKREKALLHLFLPCTSIFISNLRTCQFPKRLSSRISSHIMWFCFPLCFFCKSLTLGIRVAVVWNCLCEAMYLRSTWGTSPIWNSPSDNWGH